MLECLNLVLVLTIHLDQDTLHVQQAVTVGEPTDLALSTIPVMVYVGNSSTCLMRRRNENISIVVFKRRVLHIH